MAQNLFIQTTTQKHKKGDGYKTCGDRVYPSYSKRVVIRKQSENSWTDDGGYSSQGHNHTDVPRPLIGTRLVRN